MDPERESSADGGILLDDVILTSSRIFVVRDGDTIAGIMAVTASADLREKVHAKTRQYSALKNIIARDPQEETLFDMYLNTLIINGNLLASCDGNFDASLNLFMIDAASADTVSVTGSGSWRWIICGKNNPPVISSGQTVIPISVFMNTKDYSVSPRKPMTGAAMT